MFPLWFFPEERFVLFISDGEANLSASDVFVWKEEVKGATLPGP